MIVANTSISGVAVYVNTKAYNRLAADFKKTYPEAYKSAQVALRALLKRTLSQAAANAAAFSDRIPQSGKTRMRGLNGAVQFGDTGSTGASDAAPIENRGKGFVRHPVFGHMDVWTSTNSHAAFLSPAFDATKDEALEILDNAVFGAMERSVGL